MQFSLFQVHLTTRERAILLLAGVLLLGSGVFFYLAGQARGGQDALASETRSTRAALSRAATDAEIQQLREQKEQLEAAFEGGANPIGSNVSEIPVQVAAWALQAGVTVSGLTYNPSSAGAASSTSKVAKSGAGAAEIHVHTYTVRLRGSVNGLHSFLVHATTSPINPHVSNVAMTDEGEEEWVLSTSLAVASLERS